MSNGLPIFSDWNEALDAVVHALGGFKKVGVMLRPELGAAPIWCANYERSPSASSGWRIRR